MSKTNDTTKIRELTEAELAAVSGGSALQDCLIGGVLLQSGVVAVGGGGTVGGGTGTGTGFIALSPQGPGSDGFRS
jgi:bacteriocin-like protein